MNKIIIASALFLASMSTLASADVTRPNTPIAAPAAAALNAPVTTRRTITCTKVGDAPEQCVVSRMSTSQRHAPAPRHPRTTQH